MIPAAASHPLAALQGQPDSPVGNWLGYIVIFVVIVWPILRGLLENAKAQRREFERKQQRRQPVDPASGKRRPTLDELLRGGPIAMEEAPTLRPPRPAPAPAPAPSREDRRRAAEDARDEGSLVGDPFDEGSMGRDLVDSKDLADVPDEDAMERASGRNPAPPGELKGQPTFRNPSAGTPDARFTALGMTAAAMQTSGGESSRGSSDKSLARLERQYSGWKRAFILHEILGPPRGGKPLDDRTF